MKKYLILLICMLVLVTGCSFKKEEVPSKDLAIDLVLTYEARAAQSTEWDPKYEVNLFADHYMTSTYTNTEGFKTVELTDEQYQEIIDYISSEKFTSLSSDLSDELLADGTYSSITIYYNDNTTFKVGGYNVNNDVYNELVNMIREYAS